MDEAMIGRRVKVTLKPVHAGGVAEVHDGVDVFALDSEQGLVVLRTAHVHTYQKADYYFVPQARIVEVVDLGEGTRMPINTHIGEGVVKARYAASRKEEERKLECQNKNASEGEQKLFMELLKAYPRAKWEDSTIVLDDQGLKLKKPYTMEDAVYAALNDTGKVFFLDSLKKARGASGLEAQ